MKATREKALWQLTGKSVLHDVTVEQLKKLTLTYPYFAPAQLLLAIKLKTIQDKDTDEQVAKAGLYISNLPWLQFLLNQEPETLVDTAPGLPEQTVEPAILHTDAETYQQPQPVERKEQLAFPTLEKVRDIMLGGTQLLPDDQADASEPDLVATTPDETAVSTTGSDKITSLLSGHLADFKKPVADNAKLDIEAERMHTIDYFASQGIKIDLNKIPQDKLTSQLRKFTDWLKEMKHGSPEPADLGTNADLEQAVMLIAKNSNESREVVTETMAEVLHKQGQTEKAIQLYIKLSFINPEKTAYFAAKIQQLKGI